MIAQPQIDLKESGACQDRNGTVPHVQGFGLGWLVFDASVLTLSKESIFRWGEVFDVWK